MANQSLKTQSAFFKSKPFCSPLIRVEFCDDLTIASITTSENNIEGVRKVVSEKYGTDLASKPVRTKGKDIAFVWSGPNQWLAIADNGGGRDLERELKSPLNGIAAVVDHSDGRSVCRLSGPKVRDVLAKGVPIDLHPRAFKTNSVAISHASHIGIILWQTDETPTYEIAMFRSFAPSFMHWLQDSAEEYLG